jgi:hypothetical protein
MLMDGRGLGRMATAPTSRTGRRTVLGGLLVGGTAALGGVGRRPGLVAAQGTPAAGQEHHVYFGWLLGTPELAAVAFDFDAPAEAEANVRAYVCDGLGPPNGMAVWFRGTASEEEMEGLERSVTLTSPTGKETLVIAYRSEYGIHGAFTGADGRLRGYAAFRAVDGAGIYDVSLDPQLTYRGSSTDGNILEAQATLEEHEGMGGQRVGHVTGTITTPDGEVIPFNLMVLAHCPEEDLRESGLPTQFVEFAENSLVPGQYVAVLSPAGMYWLGRSGRVRDGDPGGEIIGLNKKE